MKASTKTALTVLSVFALAATVHAAEGEAAPAPSGNGEGVVGKVEKAVEHGATAAAEGVKKGVNWAAHGVEKGANAAAHGIEVGAKATSRTAKKIASKVTGKGSSASEPAESAAKSEGAEK